MDDRDRYLQSRHRAILKVVRKELDKGVGDTSGSDMERCCLTYTIIMALCSTFFLTNVAPNMKTNESVDEALDKFLGIIRDNTLKMITRSGNEAIQ